jgi:hypothetical protein
MKLCAVVALCSSALAFAPPAQADVVNGGFETGTFAGLDADRGHKLFGG